jgi:hypothetical protein
LNPPPEKIPGYATGKEEEENNRTQRKNKTTTKGAK